MLMTDDQRFQAYLGSLPAHEVTAVKQRLDHLRRDCGCRVGLIVMLSVTIPWIVYMFLAPVVGRSWQHTIVVGLVVLFVSSLIGKLMGLILARVRFHLTVRSLRRRVCVGATAQALTRAGAKSNGFSLAYIADGLDSRVGSKEAWARLSDDKRERLREAQRQMREMNGRRTK
jgi:hypothetical protein